MRVNKTLADWLVSSTDEWPGKSVKTMFSMGGRVFYETNFWPQLKLQGSIEEVYFLLRASTGQAIPVLTNAVRREQEGEALYDCIFLRVSQRDQYENEIILARKVAEQANQTKADFLSMMSHELRTPLNAIAGFSQILLSGVDGPVTEAQQEDLDCIQSASDDLLRLINDILNFARLEKEGTEIELEEVDVISAIARAESLMKPRIQEAGLQYTSDKNCPEVAIYADAGRVHQILLNLLGNAIKFTPSGGNISTGCSVFEEWVLIEVRDTGCGVPDDQLQRIFEPFVQVDRLQVKSGQRGIGLGLTICRTLAHAMKGDLTVSSSVGEGSVFTLSLPRYQSP